MTTTYADSELRDGVHTENGQASVTDSGGPGNTDSSHNYSTKTNQHPVDEGYAWVVLAGKHTCIKTIFPQDFTCNKTKKSVN